ncbi:nop2/Sun-like domain containing protein 5 [Nomia melanderi]|uniref:nop2/Sun-like domain containing protein 5 n=1 Tax=Nomia melanderi TaxID=2448451 RepID=UPI0013045B98|nr:probable 28S rRNA (cytosine-C(5))-methyltransferase [Nomia melanderi]
MSNGFVHSVKVPRLYKTASKIVREVRENGASLKTMIYEQKHPNISAIYSLCLNTLQKEAQLNYLLNQTGILENESRMDPWLAKILITELFWGKKVIKADCKPVQSILKYKEQLREKINEYSDVESLLNKTVRKPRYVRVNTLLLPMNKAISNFMEEGWLMLPKCSNYMEHLKVVKDLRKPEFIQDFHIPELLIFPPDTVFHDHPAYHNGEIILQDKASCFPAYLLQPKPGSVVLDMCAAPGMKSSHIAALMKNYGKVYAVEIDKRRYTTLCEQVKITCSSCVETLNEDSLTLEGEDYSDVEYILVDPTCSSSGMLFGQLVRGNQQCSPQRLKQLQAFQVFLLRHALMNFPNVKRVVYSTCSINPEENEQVVDEVLENVKGAYKLVSIKNMYKDSWENYSSQSYKCSDKCLYARPEEDLCNGFFVAVFERNVNVPLPAYKRKGSKVNNEQLENSEGNEDQNVAETSSGRKRKKRAKRKSTKTTQNTFLADNLNTSSDSIKIIAEICNDDEEDNASDNDNEKNDTDENEKTNEERNEDNEESEEDPPPKKVKRKLNRKKKQAEHGIPLKRKQVKMQRTKKK